MRTEARVASEIFNCSVRELHESDFYDSQMVERAVMILQAEHQANQPVEAPKPPTVH